MICTGHRPPRRRRCPLQFSPRNGGCGWTRFDRIVSTNRIWIRHAVFIAAKEDVEFRDRNYEVEKSRGSWGKGRRKRKEGMHPLCMNYRVCRRSEASPFHAVAVAVVVVVVVARHVSQTCRCENAARVDRSMHSLPRYRLSLNLHVLARLQTNRRRYVERLEEIARKTGLAEISFVLEPCTRRPIYSLSLSLALSRRSILARREDPREMEEGPIFSGELVYSLLEGREGEAACGDRETRARAIFISRRAKWKRHRAFRAPRVSQLRGSCWLRRRGEGKQFSLSLEKNFEFHPPSRDERRRRRRGERKGEREKSFSSWTIIRIETN